VRGGRELVQEECRTSDSSEEVVEIESLIRGMGIFVREPYSHKQAGRLQQFGEGRHYMFLRLNWPLQAILDGQYKIPDVVKGR